MIFNTPKLCNAFLAITMFSLISSSTQAQSISGDAIEQPVKSQLTTANAASKLIISGLKSTVINEKQINLNWIGDFLQNNSHFEVERSVDRTNFKTIGLVLDGFDGVGTSKTYMFKDISNDLLQSSIFYYRLKEISLDGSVSYSKVLTANARTVAEITPQ